MPSTPFVRRYILQSLLWKLLTSVWILLFQDTIFDFVLWGYSKSVHNIDANILMNWQLRCHELVFSHDFSLSLHELPFGCTDRCNSWVADSIHAVRQFIEFALQTHYTISKNTCLQWHFYAAVNIAECTKYISGGVAKTCIASVSAFIIPHF